jgi:hypothetical protein
LKRQDKTETGKHGLKTSRLSKPACLFETLWKIEMVLSDEWTTMRCYSTPTHSNLAQTGQFST